jgi:hypothetical protein
LRVFTGILGVLFVFGAFKMTSWRFKGEQRQREPTLAVRLVFLAVGLLLLFWAVRWPFER